MTSKIIEFAVGASFLWCGWEYLTTSGSSSEQGSSIQKPSLIAEISPEEAKERKVKGTLTGLIERYVDVCQPWRGLMGSSVILDNNKMMPVPSDSDTIDGQIIGHHLFDDIAGEHGKEYACKGARKTLMSAGIKL